MAKLPLLKKNKPAVNHEDIVSGLRKLGLRGGEIVTMHSSLSSFGWVDGGPETVIAAVREVLGPEGTILVPTMTLWSSLIREKAGNAPLIPYDPDHSPCDKNMGSIPETLRRLPGAIRSVHPMESVAAIGKHAAELC